MNKKKREQNEKTNMGCLNVSDDALECVAAALSEPENDDFGSTGTDYFRDKANGDSIL